MAYEKHGYNRTPTYTTWWSMKYRCENVNAPNYDRYGGRGIKICPEWSKSFTAFLSYMGERPDGTTLDRYPDNDGDYKPGNCRWATRREQNLNRGNNRFIELDGVRLTLSEWAEKTGLHKVTIFQRIKAGWDISEALTRPSQRSRSTNRSA